MIKQPTEERRIVASRPTQRLLATRRGGAGATGERRGIFEGGRRPRREHLAIAGDSGLQVFDV